MRLGLLIVGFILALNGAVWALQGAYIVPASFMRGPEWIAVGSAMFAVGLLILWKAQGMKVRGPAEPEQESG